MAYRHLRIEQDGDVLIVTFIDGLLLDHSLIADVSEELLAVVHEHKPAKLMISFAAVNRFCTETITTLLRLRKNLAEHGGRIALCDMRDEIREVFQIMRLDESVFEIYPSRDAGLQAIA